MNRQQSDTRVLLLQQKLEDHIDDFNKHCEDEEKRWDHLIAAQNRNTKSIEELTASTIALTESTRDIVAAWNAANGTVKVMSAVSRFFKWLSGFAFVGIVFAWLVDKFTS